MARVKQNVSGTASRRSTPKTSEEMILNARRSQRQDYATGKVRANAPVSKVTPKAPVNSGVPKVNAKKATAKSAAMKKIPVLRKR